MKRCSKCKQQKPLSDFGKDKQKRDGLTSACKDCNRPYTREYGRIHRLERRAYGKAYLANPENKAKRQAYLKAYGEKNRDRIHAYGKQWRDANREKRRAAQKRNRLHQVLRNRFYYAVRDGYVAGHAVRDMGCSVAELRDYLASKFQDGMSWDNWGKWHIDHIRPLAMFDLTKREDVVQAFHFSNLQPLWAEDNLKKGAKCA